jgi:hypothetical protein
MIFSFQRSRHRAEAGPVMPTVDPADIRGLVTTLLVSVRRLPHSRPEGRPWPPLNAVEGLRQTGAAPLLRVWSFGSSSMLRWAPPWQWPT